MMIDTPGGIHKLRDRKLIRYPPPCPLFCNGGYGKNYLYFGHSFLYCIRLNKYCKKCQHAPLYQIRTTKIKKKV